MKYNSNIEQLLANAFAGESQARNRYTIFASIAKKEGYPIISDIFLATAENEREHAKLFYKHISNGKHNVDTEYPFFIGTTIENLKSAIDGEHEEWEYIYKEGANKAKSEGYDDIYVLFSRVLEVEKYHEHRFTQLYEHLKNGTLFERNEETQWECSKCGYILINKSAPKKCPCCKHEQGYFKSFCGKQ